MSPQVRCRHWPNRQQGRECGGAGVQSLSSLLGSPHVCQGGCRLPPCVVLAEEGPDLAGMGAGAEEAQPQRGRDLPVPSPSTAAPKAGEVGRVMLDWDPNGGLPGSPEKGARPELCSLVQSQSNLGNEFSTA